MSDDLNDRRNGLVLVTGASGFVGRRLCACLRDAGFRVRGALRRPGRPVPAGVEPVVVGEIGPETDWSAALTGVVAVVHCANLAHVAARDPAALARARQVNVEGSAALARQASGHGVERFLYLSSLLARQAEQAPARGDPYAATKLEAEAALRRIAAGSAMELAILRPPLIYGPGAGANFARLLRALEGGWPLPFGAIENRRSFLWIDNLAELVSILLRHPLPVAGSYEPQDPEPLSTPAFCRALGAALGRHARLLPVPPVLLRLAGQLSGRRRLVESLTGNLVADDRSLREGLGWVAPLGTAEALQRSLAGRARRTGQGGAGQGGAEGGARAAARPAAWLEALYGGLALALALVRPLLRLYLARRAGRGREDPARLAERWGGGAAARPEGRLYWLHAASNGELTSALPLIEEIGRRRPDWQLLVTTGTVTSARLAAERLPAGALHRFLPIDEPRAVEGFFSAWRPDLGLIVESELWPMLLRRARRRGLPLALVNGRMSPRSFRVWRALGPIARDLIGCFRLVLAQSRSDARRLAELGAPARCLGNLKDCAAPLPADPDELRRLRQATVGRTLWLAASTHPGEEAMVADAHRAISVSQGSLLTILAPRHARRGAAVRRLLEQRGLTVAQRSRGEPIEATTDVYLADTMGELGLWYRLARLAFVGGSLVPHGGQNPLEAAKLGCAVVSGRQVVNFQETVDRLEAAGGILLVEDTNGLAAAVGALLADPHRRQAQAEQGLAAAEAQAGALAEIVEALDPLFAEAERR
ncbi:3-deoxy-D-manno-octulosonic-acid transferase [Tistlia consotensis]|uniref:3-deoxy-D-manno-octulosonic acid transferase n=1 Tax=Tistlia consotensis USBA 355 TaxID=560819 RepID=A0A1Y6CCB2_9PROT|nr:glycosyltransferase N-terminal domain-containing protein [Tistlia consotensis]SMF54371.1 3-deoxy-D-manno-octulosonic-acid transferase [Tistlia consotensis USBA 355]SNR86872.1 3-deoxy-D-manno-octulosonic-acid transferase [Tistlia consotensis]